MARVVMTRYVGGLAALLCGVFGGLAHGETVSFVACPIAQDTGPNTDLCFFTEYRGRRISLAGPEDWGAPQLGHRVLVEGELIEDSQACGGVRLDGRVSVLWELAPECNLILPFETEPQVEPAPVSERARWLHAEIAMLETDPSRSLQSVRLPPGPPVEVAIGRTEIIYYPFDSDRSSGPDAQRFVKLAHLARDTPGAFITIHAYRGVSLLDDGTLMSEREDMAEQRANKVAGILAGLGAPAARIEAHAHVEAPKPTGRADWQQRWVEVTVEVR